MTLNAPIESMGIGIELKMFISALEQEGPAPQGSIAFGIML